MAVRGEFKTPGGKLIAVEFDIREERLRNVVITGDFFLYPEEALANLARVLEGSPVTLDEREFAALIQPILDGEVELLGSSAEALAAAVTRAIGAAGSDGADG